jgi:hypothetical protein
MLLDMDKKRKNIYLFNIISGCLLFLFFFLWCSNQEKDEQSLIENKVLTYGQVLYTSRIPKSSGSSFWIEYEFKLNDTLFQNKTTINIDYDHVNIVHDILFLKSLPLIYDKTNVENNKMLFLKDDYIRFGLVRPDTLSDIFNKLDSLSSLNKE